MSRDTAGSRMANDVIGGISHNKIKAGSAPGSVFAVGNCMTFLALTWGEAGGYSCTGLGAFSGEKMT